MPFFVVAKLNFNRKQIELPKKKELSIKLKMKINKFL